MFKHVAVFAAAGLLSAQTTWEGVRAQGKDAFRVSDFAAAELLLRRTLELAGGDADARTVASLQDLAELYEAQGRYSDAEKELRRALALRETALGPENPELKADIEAVARVLAARSQLVEADAMLSRSLAIQEKALGRDRLELLPTLGQLARVRVAMGEAMRGELPLLRAVAIREKVQGPAHPDLAAELITLARFLAGQKRWLAAEPRLARAISILEVAAGHLDRRLLPALDLMANVKVELQRLAEAEAALRRALVIRERDVGPHHSEVAPTLDLLATVLYKMKRYAEAESMSARALNIWIAAVGSGHILLATSYDNLAVAQAAQQNYEEAEENYGRALAIREEAAARGVLNQAMVQVAQGKLPEAEALYAGAMGVVDRLEPGSPVAIAIWKNYAALLRLLKKPAEAARIAQRLAPGIQWNFEGGNLAKVEKIAETHFRCHVSGETDQDKRNRQASWYYFRVDNVEGREVTIDLAGLPGEYNYQPNRGAITKDTIPVFSFDRRTWRHLPEADYDAAIPRLRLRFTPESSPVWIAHVAPYTNTDLRLLIRSVARHPHFEKKAIGKSVQGRDLLLLTVTNPETPAASKRVVWLMFRQHAWEAGSSWAGDGALRFLLSDDPQAVKMRDTAIFKILPLADPDGVARGGVRFNANGYDLNRNWDTATEKAMPEIAAQRKAVLEWVDGGGRVDVFLTLHNTETAEYLDGPPEGFAELRNRLFALLVEKTSFYPSRRPGESRAAPAKPGRATVVDGLYQDRKAPAFLIEQRIAFHDGLKRAPTVEDRQRFGADLVKALWEAVQGSGGGESRP
jgi:tetratricopeptide (TPR) repeat protein